MLLPGSLVVDSLKKLQASEEGFAASIPWEGVSSLASHWAGAGSLFDWLAPDDWVINREWTPEIVRARVAEAVLLHIQGKIARYLPSHADGWLDLLHQQTQRVTHHSEVPTAHTDWQATIASFGRYPSNSYIERRPIQTHDTSFSRVLKWTAQSVRRAEQTVWTKFNRRPLSASTRLRLTSALELNEIATTSNVDGGLTDYDKAACREAGGVWLALSRAADLLSALWSSGLAAQLIALKPILPEFSHQLFELGVLGTIASGLRGISPNQRWHTKAPFAASSGGQSSLSLVSDAGSWEAYFQTIPPAYRKNKSPYLELTKGLDGRPLRPDIWLVQKLNGEVTEIIVECKYSLNPTYICSGVTQSFSYATEFPPVSGAKRIHITVGPDEIVEEPRCSGSQFVIANPYHAKALCVAAFQRHLPDLFNKWEAA